jgi:hypothetical protein
VTFLHINPLRANCLFQCTCLCKHHTTDKAVVCNMCVMQVPLELIEWQPVFHQVGATGLSGGKWSDNWRVSGSGTVQSNVCVAQGHKSAAPQAVYAKEASVLLGVWVFGGLLAS